MREPWKSKTILLASREGCERTERERAWEDLVTGRARTTPPNPPFARGGKTATPFARGGKTASPFARGGKTATPFARGGKTATAFARGGKTAQRNRDESAFCARPTFHQARTMDPTSDVSRWWLLPMAPRFSPTLPQRGRFTDRA